MFFDGEKRHAYRVLTFSGNWKAQASSLASKKAKGDLNENAGAISGFWIAAARTTVREVDEHLDALAQNLVRLLAPNIDDKTHAAGIVFTRGVVQPLCSRKSASLVVFLHRSVAERVSFGWVVKGLEPHAIGTA